MSAQAETKRQALENEKDEVYGEIERLGQMTQELGESTS